MRDGKQDAACGEPARRHHWISERLAVRDDDDDDDEVTEHFKWVQIPSAFNTFYYEPSGKN